MSYLSDEDDDDVDIDKCLGCGRYYGTTENMVTQWMNSLGYRDGDVMPQLCHRCLRGDPPPHEY